MNYNEAVTEHKKPRPGEPFDGESAVAELLEKMDVSDRDRLLRDLETRDPKLVARLKERAFRFDQLIEIEQKGIQLLISSIPRPRWIMALRKVSDELAAHIYGALPARTREQFEEEMRELGPQRMSDVLAAQTQIAEIAKRHLDDGMISLIDV